MSLPPSLPRPVIPSAQRKAFTLIELLAVIGIVACLATLMLPAVSTAQRKGLDAKTLARMKTLSAAYTLYASDNSQHVVPRSDGNTSASAPTVDLTLALAPFLDLKETGSARLASPVWWDAVAERNGTRNKDNTEGDLYYPDPPAWSGGPPRNKLTGFYFNPYAHDPNGVSGSPHDTYAFGSLAQVAHPSKTALVISRRADKNSGDTAWNSWSDGKKYNAANPASIGAKRFIVYLDGHLEIVTITDGKYSGNSPSMASEVHPEYIAAEPVFYNWR